MLDSLGSTLTRFTIASFFTRYGKNPHEDEISIEQAVMCLETELGRPDSEKKRLDTDDSMQDSSVSATPVMFVAGQRGEEVPLDLDKLDFSGPVHLGLETGHEHKLLAPAPYVTEPMQIPLDVAEETPETSSDDAENSSTGITPVDTPGRSTSETVNVAKKSKRSRFKRSGTDKSKDASEDSSNNSSNTTTSDSNPIERLINVKNCPLCHRPRLNSKAEIDIITHLAICASQDWNAVDRIVVGNFVTASQAQRKWYTKIITKVSSGDYKLGAVSFILLLSSVHHSFLIHRLFVLQNSANIIVQNRMTGQLEEEKMQVYVRLGIRLLYKGATSRMEGGRGMFECFSFRGLQQCLCSLGCSSSTPPQVSFDQTRNQI